MKLKIHKPEVESVSSFEDNGSFIDEKFDLPQDVLDQLPSYLFHDNDSVLVDRVAPTNSQKVVALFDYWTFLDIIYFHGGSKNFANCHKELMEWNLREKASLKQLVLEARGHLKSTLLSVGKTLWRIYQNPNIRILVGTESLKLSKAFIREIKAYLEDDWLQNNVWNSRPHIPGRLIPIMDKTGRQRRIEKYGDESEAQDKKVVWRADAIQVNRDKKLKEPTVVAASVGQTNTGSHVDEVILDDVVTFDNVATLDKIEKVFSWIYDISSILDPAYMDYGLLRKFQECSPAHWKKMARWAVSGGRQTVIGTRYDEEDYYGHLIEHSSILGYDIHVRNIYSNGVDNSDGYRWPEKWNEQYETQTRAELEKRSADGRKRFNSQYLNKIVDEQDIVLAWHKIVWFHSTQVKLEDNGFVTIKDKDGKVEANIRPYICIDPAATVSKTSDFTAMAVGGYSKENHLYILDVKAGKFLPDEWVKHMYALCDKWHLNSATIESVVFSNTLHRMIRDTYFEKYRPLVLREFYPGNQQSKWDRIEESLYPLIHNGMFHCTSSCQNDRVMKSQFMGFGKETVKDDIPDVIQALSKVAIHIKPSKVAKFRKPRHVVNRRFGGYNYA